MDFTLNNISKTSLNWLFPQKCLICSDVPKHNHPCCRQCYLALPFYSSACHQCGQPLLASSDFCGRCINNSPHYDACFCPFEYKDAIKGLIQNFKYNEKPELATNLAALLEFELFENNISLPDLIIPVPLHISRLRSRGYNQSSLIAKKVSKNLNIPISDNFISRHRNTDAQAGLSFKKRQKNLKNSFRIKNNFPAKSVALIDDVVTSGTTVNEISKILKKNGVDYIQVWGLAHTI